MARRAENTNRVSVYKGRFYRNLGKLLGPAGLPVPKKFLLGTNLPAAEIANRLLERLWICVVSEHKTAEEFVRRMSRRLGDVNQITGVIDYQRLRRVEHGPIWREESLAIAEAIRRSQREILVEVGDDANMPGKYVERIVGLRECYDVISFVPASSELYVSGQKALAGGAQQTADDAQDEVQRLSSLAQTPLPVLTGATLYQALEGYAKFALQKNSKAHGEHESACARRLMNSHPDISLSQFGISALEAIAAYWASRPLGKVTGRPVALSTVTNHLKTTRRFIKWLHRTDAFKWTKPIDAEDALRVRVAGLRSRVEIAALRDGVAGWKIDELATLYRYGSDRERVLILLGLNCGFAQAEMCTLCLNEIVSVTDSTIIKRIRHKSQVYGEFVLWPETVTAINWFTKYARGTPQTIAGENPKDFLMVTGQGNCYERQQLANMWNKLLDRVQLDHPMFRRLSFKCLRKTAGQLIRERSDGEIAGVFLCHGQAVASDSLADVYTNRPFNKVATALVLVRRDLQPLFDAAPTAFTKKPGSSPNITLGVIELIRRMHSDGVCEAEIVRTTGRTLQTVRRWINRDKTLPDRQVSELTPVRH